MFIVHNELEDGWMWVTNLRTDEQGLIVEDLVEEVVSSFIFKSLKNYIYTHLYGKYKLVKCWNASKPVTLLHFYLCAFLSLVIESNCFKIVTGL